MSITDYDCPHCQDVGLRKIVSKEAVSIVCPRCKRVAAVMWLQDPEPGIAGQMSLQDYPETAA